MSDDQTAYSIVIRGRVTGVGFRFSAERRARELQGISGWVRNRDAQTVECHVQGPGEQVDKMLNWLRRGPSTARVQSCDIASTEPNPRLLGFTIRY